MWGFPQIRGTVWRVPIIRTWGSILGSPYFGKIPFTGLGLDRLRAQGFKAIDISQVLGRRASWTREFRKSSDPNGMF